MNSNQQRTDPQNERQHRDDLRGIRTQKQHCDQQIQKTPNNRQALAKQGAGGKVINDFQNSDQT